MSELHICDTMYELHMCNEIDEDAFKIYREKSLVNTWILEDVDDEDHYFYIWFCPYCGVKLDE